MVAVSRMRKPRGVSEPTRGKATNHNWINSKEFARANAAFSSWLIVLFLMPLWILQFLVWIISLAGIGVEGMWLVSWLLPGEEIFTAFSIIGALIGMLMMGIALSVYLIRGVDYWSGWLGLIFALCLTFSMMPLFFFVPYVFFWCFCVTILQTGGPKSEE